MNLRRDDGETLVEVVISLVLISLAVTVLFAGFTTAARSSKSHRDLAVVDVTLRSYAESIKNTVRSSCTTAGSTYTLPSQTLPGGVTGLTPAPGSSSTCPAASLTAAQSLPTVTLTATYAGGTKSLTIGVRTP